ncbi:esterase 1 [Mycena crocata]|nr:esterase 1 [Mycena crocata]
MSTSLEFFGGIPFAEPPVGPLRFNRTVPKIWLPPGEFDARNFGRSCLQQGLSPDVVSEDCLTVNIVRPAGSLPNASLPVVSAIASSYLHYKEIQMFWIYGGGFIRGGAAQYDASAIVAQSVARGTPIIYVSFDYRLGPLGFPQGLEAFARGSLNLGLRDQLACLEWVQLCIGAFGGDPAKVTLFGQSAGAILSAVLFLGGIEHLARAAIFESGSAGSAGVFGEDRGETDWQNFVSAVPGCSSAQNTSSTVACLQGVDAADIMTAWSNATFHSRSLIPWAPCLDGPGGFLPTLPSIMLRNGSFSRLPFIAGTNQDEGTIFTPPNLNFSEQLIQELIVLDFSPPFTSSVDLQSAAHTIVHMYPSDPVLGSPYNTGNETFGMPTQYKRAAAIEGDISFQSPRRLWARLAAAQGVKVFCYLFTQPQIPPPLGVYHGSEVRFVYGGINPGSNSSDASLSKVMMDYWLSFATSLDPNDGHGVSRPLWTSYTADDQNLMQLNGENTTMIPDDYRKDEIGYMMSIADILHQ